MKINQILQRCHKWKAFTLFNLLRAIYQHPFNRQKPIFAFVRMVRWQLDKRFKKQNEYTYSFWNDRKILCFPDSLETMWIVYNYIMDWEEFNFIEAYLKENDCAFDVRANIGIYAFGCPVLLKREESFALNRILKIFRDVNVKSN